jgi:hypothetical protein
MDDVGRETIRERKDVCGGCGAELRKVGEIQAGDRRGDEYECSRETCGYVEWRMYGDTYYELQGE